MKILFLGMVCVLIASQALANDLTAYTNQIEKVIGVKLTEKSIQLNGPNCRILVSAENSSDGRRVPHFNLQVHNPKTWEVKAWSFYLGLGSFTCESNERAINGEKVFSTFCKGQECETQGCVDVTYTMAVSSTGIKVDGSPVCRYR